MALPQIWSRRKRNRAGGSGDPLQYKEIPRKVRVQIVHILGEVEDECRRISEGLSELVSDLMRKELGVHRLADGYHPRRFDELAVFLEHLASVDDVLDIIEIYCRLSFRWKGRYSDFAELRHEQLFEEINARLLEAGVGFQLAEHYIVQASDTFNHKEAVVPALSLLAEVAFESANAEFLRAHQAFREGDNETASVECLKALESTLKKLSAAHGWGHSEHDTANKLIGLMFEHEFLPPFLTAQFSSLRSLLEAGIPTMRNRVGGHGAGETPRIVPKSFAAYQVNQTGAVIRLLVERHKELMKEK